MSDVNKLVAQIAKGWDLVPTPKVRVGMEKGQQQLVKANGKTLAMLTIRKNGVRIEGGRLSHALLVMDEKAILAAPANTTGNRGPQLGTVADARTLLQGVAAENAAKAKKPAAPKSATKKEPSKSSAGAKAA